MNLKTLSAAKLEALRTRYESEVSAMCDELIDEGRGRERPSETRTKSDPLSVRYTAALSMEADVHDECAYRREYHGSLKRVRGRA